MTNYGRRNTISKSKIEVIQRLQNIAIRIIGTAYQFDGNEIIHRVLNIPSIQNQPIVPMLLMRISMVRENNVCFIQGIIKFLFLYILGR